MQNNQMKDNKMRKNPYNKNMKEHLTLFMLGSRTTSALIANDEQKTVVAKTRVQKQKYDVKGVSFTMVQPPVLNLDFTLNPQNITNMEMGQTEVTQALFQAVKGWNNSYDKSNPQNPVEMVTWFDCISFCNKLSALVGLQKCYTIKAEKRHGYYIESAEVTWEESANGFRLPTIEEWGLFSKAGTQNEWAGTNKRAELEDFAWLRYNSGYEPHPVGGRKPNEWGLYDMSGNVWEWCWDTYHFDATSPLDVRILRGGAYDEYTDGCGISETKKAYTHMQSRGIGFRICRQLVPGDGLYTHEYEDEEEEIYVDEDEGGDDEDSYEVEWASEDEEGDN